MKYEPVFGDQSLFDGAPEGATHATKGGGFYKIENMSAKYVSDGIFNGADVLSVSGNLIAERRIIPEPKRWTVEDQKAGRLPEVGCIVEYFNNNEHDNTEVTAQWRNGDELEILRHQNKNKAFVVFNARAERSSDLIVQCMKPIETPKEKAQREEDEWVNKAWGETAVFAGVTQDEHDRLRIHLRHIYRAQLSGKLAAPKGGEL